MSDDKLFQSRGAAAAKCSVAKRTLFATEETVSVLEFARDSEIGITTDYVDIGYTLIITAC